MNLLFCVHVMQQIAAVVRRGHWGFYSWIIATLSTISQCKHRLQRVGYVQQIVSAVLLATDWYEKANNYRWWRSNKVSRRGKTARNTLNLMHKNIYFWTCKPATLCVMLRSQAMYNVFQLKLSIQVSQLVRQQVDIPISSKLTAKCYR